MPPSNERAPTRAVKVEVDVTGELFVLEGFDRDWFPMEDGSAPKGRVVELKSSPLGLVAWGSSQGEAVERMVNLIRCKLAR